MPLDADRKREIAFGAGLLALVIVVAFAGEALLRLRQALGTNWVAMRPTIMAEDVEAGFSRFVPGTEFGTLRVNRLGFTSPEVDIPKPAGTLRLAFLGDSVVLGAGLPQDKRIAATVTAAVQEALPTCKVDYVTIAGPGYRLSEIAALLGESAAQIDADAYVLVTGGVREILKAMDAAEGPHPAIFRPERGWLYRHSLLFPKAERAYTAVAISRLHPSNDLYSRIDKTRYATTYHRLIDAVAAEIGQTPTLVIENRGQERDGDNDATLGRLDRVLLSELNGMSVPGLRQLEILRRQVLAQAAAAQGWPYLDPFADLPATNAFYLDPMHLTADGNAAITPGVTERLIDLIEAQGTAPDCLP